MVRRKSQGGGMKRKNKSEDNKDKIHYAEFGEAHPLNDTARETPAKKIRIEADYESDNEGQVSEDELSSDEEQETDAVSKLLATFNTGIDAAVDSDDESEEEEESDDSEGEVSEASSVEYDGLEELDRDDDYEEGIEDKADSSLELGEKHKIAKVSDKVKKTEEEKEVDVDDDAEDDDDDDGDLQNTEDSFRKHFELDICTEAAEEVKKVQSWSSHFEEWPTLGRIKVDLPKVEVSKSKPLLLLDEVSETESPNVGCAPKPPKKKNYNLDDYYVVQRLKENVPLVSCASASCPSGFTSSQKELFAIMSNYTDLYYPEVTHDMYKEISTVYAVHALNHALKTRRRVLRHNSKISKDQVKRRMMRKERKKKKKKDEKEGGNDSEHCYRDQGYTRPKVLIVVPFKHSAYRVIEIMSSLLQDKKFEVLKDTRFHDDYGPGDESHHKNSNKPEDFQAIFEGNSDEDFKIGIKLTRCTLKLYSDFFSSDIIIASPLGLRRLMGTFNLGSADMDFLSSIEVLIIDQADILLMQNWEHVLVLMEVLNKPPHNIHDLDVDLTRIRMWTLDGHSSLYRQTILFTSTNIDHNRALVNKCRNFTGRVQVLNHVSDGSIQEVIVPSELALVRMPGMRDPDARFNYFVKEVLPQYQANRRIGVMVYIPDYCDYIRLVRYLREDGGMSYSSINEYMIGDMGKVAKARTEFFYAKRPFMLLTERFHFYKRCIIKGVRHVIFYDMPTYPHFFSEICNLMVEGNQNRRTLRKHLGTCTVSVLYQQCGLTRLVGIVGSQKAGEIAKAKKNIHVCTVGT